MKKYLYIIFVFIATLLPSVSNAVIDITESQIFVTIDIENAVSKWIKIPEQNVGVGISVIAGSCRVQITPEPYSKCDKNTAIFYSWDESLVIINAVNQKYRVINGASCVRVDCTQGKANVSIRK